MDRLNQLLVMFLVSGFVLSVVPPGVRAGYNIGVGIADVTGPSAEIGFVSTTSCLLLFSANCPCCPYLSHLHLFPIYLTVNIYPCTVNEPHSAHVTFDTVLFIPFREMSCPVPSNVCRWQEMKIYLIVNHHQWTSLRGPKSRNAVSTYLCCCLGSTNECR
jgi:hypothetical protein